MTWLEAHATRPISPRFFRAPAAYLLSVAVAIVIGVAAPPGTETWLLIAAVGVVPFLLAIPLSWLLSVALLSLTVDTFKFGPLGLVSTTNLVFALLALRLAYRGTMERSLDRGLRVPASIAAGVALAFLPAALIGPDRGAALRLYLSVVAMAFTFAIPIAALAGRGEVRSAVNAWLLAGVVAGAFALLQFVFYLAGVSLGVATEVTLLNVDVTTLRAEGLSGSTNYLALFLLPYPFVSMSLLTTGGPWRRDLLFAALGLSALGIALTFSRGAIMAVAVVSASALAAGLGRRLPRFAIAPQLIVGVVAVLATYQLFSFLSGFNEVSLQTRLSLIAGGLQAFSASPVFGQGLGTQVETVWNDLSVALAPGATLSDVITQRVELRDTHNTVLYLLSQAGLIGLAAFVALVAATATIGLRGLKVASVADRPLLRGLMFGTAAMLVAALFEDALVVKQLYVTLALVWVAARRPAIAADRPVG